MTRNDPIRTMILLALLTLALVALPAGALVMETDSAAANDARVSVFDTGYSDSDTGTPVTVVAPGDTVTWTWDSGVHSVTDQLGSFDSGVRSTGSADDFSATFDAAGVFAYFCELHPTMNGVVVVA